MWQTSERAMNQDRAATGMRAMRGREARPILEDMLKSSVEVEEVTGMYSNPGMC